MDITSIRALILDYGGVISLPQDADNGQDILHSLGLAPVDIAKVYRRLRPPYDRGQITGEQYWAGVLQQFGLRPADFDLARLVEKDVQSWTHLNPAMIRFITEARGQVQQLAIISNMTHDTLAYMRQHFDWLRLFDVLCFSCELGRNKPEREIYDICLRRLQVNAGECLFVDDSTRNVAGAQAVGMQALHYTTFAEFSRQVMGRGDPPPA